MNVGKETAALGWTTVSELRERYEELFNETTQARNRTWLVRRIVWRMQSLESGGLSELAIRLANELASGADLRVTATREARPSPDAAERSKTVACQIESGSRVPLPGTVITRHYKGRLLQVKTLPKGFKFEGKLYKSLSAMAKHVTGSHWNGYAPNVARVEVSSAIRIGGRTPEEAIQARIAHLQSLSIRLQE